MHRETVVNYSKNTNFLYLVLMGAVLESLGLIETTKSGTETKDASTITLKEFEEGSQLIVVNYYPACPEPDLTLGLPPHSDYGILTLLLQDQVQGLQIQHQGKWMTVEPLPNSFIVNVGDHLEVASQLARSNITSSSHINNIYNSKSIDSYAQTVCFDRYLAMADTRACCIGFWSTRPSLEYLSHHCIACHSTPLFDLHLNSSTKPTLHVTGTQTSPIFSSILVRVTTV